MFMHGLGLVERRRHGREYRLLAGSGDHLLGGGGCCIVGSLSAAHCNPLLAKKAP